MVRSYRDLRVWQLAMELVEQSYTLTRGFPREEMYVLAFQVRRSAVSIPSNIAEGRSRASRREFLHHLSITSASLAELETQVEIASRLGYVDRDDHAAFHQRTQSLGRQLGSLRKALTRASNPQPPVPSPR